MTLDELLPMLDAESIKMGDIKKIAQKIKTDHELAQKLWSTKKFHPRLLAVLIMDKKCLDQNYINQLVQDMKSHDTKQSNQISEWLLANQLTKSKKTIQLLESWKESSEPILQRLFWYYQARLRWTGKIHDDTPQLMEYLENNMENADPVVQWGMNLCAGWIGVFDTKYRSRCIALGKKLGLYKGEAVSKGCTPSYLPEFIKIEVAKRKK